MKRILITGGSGLVGSRITELLREEYDFISPSSTELDVSNAQVTANFINEVSFDICVHLAAYTNVDLAETEQEKAHILNVAATDNLFTAVKKKKKPFIFFSTDFVFSGTNPPYVETSSPNPISTYGKTKWQAEQLLYDQAMIVRIAYPYRKAFEKKRDFVRTIAMLLGQGKEVSLIKDTLITPTYIDDIAHSLQHLINNYSPRIYHIVGSNSLSVYEAGIIIAEAYGFDTSLIKPISFETYFEGKARRPQFSRIQSDRNTFFKMSSFEEGIERMKATESG